jgi:hypothetical protein
VITASSGMPFNGGRETRQPISENVDRAW